jgi:hypothetical protein
METLGKLVAVSDVVYENNATGTMEGLGITYDWLKRHNPNIIFVRVPAYGNTGTYSQARALGVHLEAVMGHTLLRGYDDADPSANTAIYSGDYLAGAQGAFAVPGPLAPQAEGRASSSDRAGENAAAMFRRRSWLQQERVVGGPSAGRARAPLRSLSCKSPGTETRATTGRDLVEDDEGGLDSCARWARQWTTDRPFAKRGRGERFRGSTAIAGTRRRSTTGS